MAITQRHLYGWRMEEVLQPRLEEILGEKLVKTQDRYATRDFVTNSNTWKIEGKSRPKMSEKGYIQDHYTYDSFLMPVHKGDNMTDEDRLIFFYHFERSDSLWFIPYQVDLFKTFPQGIPKGSSYLHWYIPKEEWFRLQEGDRIVNDEDGICIISQ